MRHLYLKLVFLSCLYIFCTSCSYAYTLDEFLYFTEQVHDMNINQYFNYVTDRILTFKDELKLMNDFNNYSNYICVFGNGTTPSTSITIYASNTGINIYRQNSTQIQLPAYKSFKVTSIKYAGGWQPVSNENVNYFQRLNSFGLTSYTGSADFTGYYWQNTYIPPPTGPVFTSVSNGLVSVNLGNGTTENMQGLPFNRTINQVKIGRITDIDDTVYNIWGYFGPLVSADSSGTITNNKYQFRWNKYNGVTSNGLSIASDGNVYIATRYLIPKQAYQVYFSYNTTADLEYTDFGPTWFYTYYSNNPVSSGDGISNDLNDDTDIGFVNALNDYFSYNSGDKDNMQYILNQDLFNFDFNSGDFVFSSDGLANNLGYNEEYRYNRYTLFIYELYRALIDKLGDTNTTNSHLSFTIRNHNYDIYASSLTVPDGALKSFVRLFFIGGTIYLIYLQFHYILLSIQVMDLLGTIKSFDHKISFFM